MNSAKIKKLFLLLLLTELLFAYAPAFAQSPSPAYNSGVDKQIESYLCDPTATGSGVLYQCINQIYKFALVLASVLGVLFIVIAGYVYMSADGNSESVDKAKSILESTIVSLVILFGGFVLLNSINPDLVQFHGNTLQPVSITVPAGGAGGGVPPSGGGVVPDVATAAKTLLGLKGVTVASTNCDCSGNCAINTLQLLTAGRLAVKDAPTTCNAGTVPVNLTMLNALISTANSGTGFMIQSITGGHHGMATNNTNDPHYQGNAVDVTPQPADANTQSKLVNSLFQYGATTVALECSGGPNNGYLPLNGTSAGNPACIGKSGYHIHAQW
jgi:hypothetical protein